MSKTLDQIYIANPITTNDNTDLMYFSRSPYTTGNDVAMLFSDFAAQFGTTFGFATKVEVQQSQFNIGVDTGVADAYVVTLTPASASLTEGLIVEFIPLHTNLTTTPTVNVDGHGVIGISLLNADAVIAADIHSGVNTILQYDSNANLFFLQNPQLSYTTARNVQENNYNSGVDSGSANVYDISITPAPPGTLPNAFPVCIRAIANTNTGASTFALNGGSALPIVALDGSALVGGELVAANNANLEYNLANSNWVLQNSALTGVGGGVTAADLQEQAYTFAHDTGTANTYVVSYSPAVTTYDNINLTFVANVDNTGASTIDINGLGAVPLIDVNGNALVAGMIVSNFIYQIIYNSGHIACQLINPSIAPASTIGVQIQEQLFTYSTDTGADGTHYIGTYSPVLAATPTDGTIVGLLAAHTTGGGGATFDAGFGANTIVLNDGTYSVVAPLDSIIADGYYQFEWNNANSRWVLLNPSIAPFLQYNLNTIVVDGGTTNAYSGDTTPVSSTQLNSEVWLHPANSNTGASTFTLGATTNSIVKLDGSALVGGEIVASNPANLVFNNTNWVLQNSALTGSGGGITATQVQQNTFNVSIDSGSLNAYVGVYAPAVMALAQGAVYTLTTVNSTNTGAATFDNGAGALPILTPELNPLVGGEMVINNTYQLMESEDSAYILMNSSLAGNITALQIQQQAFVFSEDTGTANNYILSFTPAISSGDVIDGMKLGFVAANTNTTASGISYDSGVNTVALLVNDGTFSTNIEAGNIVAGVYYEVEYNVGNTAFVLLNPTNTFVTPTEVQSNQFNLCGTDTGTADNYLTTLTPTLISSYPDGMPIVFLPANSNLTFTPNINIDGMGAVNFILPNNQQLNPGDISAGIELFADYAASQNAFILRNPQVSYVTSNNIQNNTNTFAIDTGVAANAYVGAYTPSQASPSDGTLVYLNQLNAANNGATTFQYSGSAAIPVVTQDGTVLIGGELSSTSKSYSFLFDAILGNWIIQNSDLPKTILTPSSGDTISLPNSWKCLTILNPAATLATLTIELPASPTDGMTAIVSSTQIVTSLTVDGNGNTALGTQTALTVGQSFTMVFDLATTTWYPA